MIRRSHAPAGAPMFARRARAKARALRPIIALTLLNIVFTCLLAGPTLASNAIHVIGLTIASANGLYCQLAGCTMTGLILVPDGGSNDPGFAFASDTPTHRLGMFKIASGRVGIGGNGHTSFDVNVSSATVGTPDQLIFNNVATDITTGANEDLTLGPNGTGALAITKHIKASGAQAVTAAGGSCTTPALAGTDDRFTASAASCGAAGTVTGNFGATWGAAPNCSATPNDTNAAAGVAFVTTTTTAFTVTSKNATGAAAGWNVHCVE